MKKLIPIVLLLFSLNSFSQTYFPFPDSVGVWREIAVFGDPIFDPPEYNYRYVYFINGDTIIDSNTYSKLYTYYCNTITVGTPNPIQIPACLNIDTASSTYFGAIREVNKRVYFRPDTNYNYGFCPDIGSGPTTNTYNQDLLLYDFNVIVGDTVFYPHLDSMQIVITTIDSILIQGQYRKKYNYWIITNNSPCGIFSGNNYVEGIGDKQAGLFSLWTFYFENATGLVCFEDDEVIYPSGNGCTFTGIKETFTENNLKIYPNPSSTNLTIELIDINSSFKAKVYLTDITGKEIYSTSINSTINNIDVSSFRRGIYLLKIISDNGEVKSSLVSIQ